MDINELVQRSDEIREQYHRIEQATQGGKWTIEQDTLAFLTDAGLLSRLIMDKTGSWPTGENNEKLLAHKIGENIWWLTILANQANINVEQALDTFLTETKTNLSN